MHQMNDAPGVHAGRPMRILAALFALSLATACEHQDDVDSQSACREYCDKRSACDEVNATNKQDRECVNACRSDIENNCGNDLQGAANAKIEACVDLSCDDFDDCMFLDDAPECFEFAND
jgi:hypothetical protein